MFQRVVRCGALPIPTRRVCVKLSQLTCSTQVPRLSRSYVAFTAPNSKERFTPASSNSDSAGFPILGDAVLKDVTAPTFLVGTRNGFLPREDPLEALPKEFEMLESLLQRMSLRLPDGKPGLLAKGEFGDAVDKELPLYDVSKIVDARLLSALYRDYTFAASAYLLEPCDLVYKASKKEGKSKGEYGLGRQKLPKSIALPLTILADRIKAKPFMEYALSYALYNYKKKDPALGLTFDNISLIRKFSGSRSEHGFITVHVTMVSHSGDLVRACMDVLDGAATRDRSRFDSGLKNLCATYQKINNEMETMWERSLPGDYLDFRTFIMGTKNQPMFPNGGVVFEGVGADGSNVTMAHRGESGANDSMVPMGDNLLQITENMPDNLLTQTLRDFRTYRPENHQNFLSYVEKRAREVDVRGFAEREDNSASYYLANIDQIRAFRHRHWSFTKEYIIKYTEHPVATGGSPIVTWLPNQLETVLRAMEAVGRHIDPAKLTPHNREIVEDLIERAVTQRRVLNREVAALKKTYKGQDISEDQV